MQTSKDRMIRKDTVFRHSPISSGPDKNESMSSKNS